LQPIALSGLQAFWLRKILAPLTKRWDHDAGDIEPVKKVTSECAFLPGLFQVRFCGCYHTDGDFDAHVTSEPFQRAFLQDP